MVDLETFYSPQRVRLLLRDFGNLEAWAEDVRQTLEPPARGGASDNRTWATIVADLERAWTRLPMHSLEWRTVEICLQGRGFAFGRLARALQIDSAEVWAAFDRACRQMAAFLGWTDDDALRTGS